MKYRELYDEYRELLAYETKLRQEMHRIPKGYLVTKKIAGKEYLYLQYTAQGKKKSEYIHEEDWTSKDKRNEVSIKWEAGFLICTFGREIL